MSSTKTIVKQLPPFSRIICRAYDKGKFASKKDFAAFMRWSAPDTGRYMSGKMEPSLARGLESLERLEIRYEAPAYLLDNATPGPMEQDLEEKIEAGETKHSDTRTPSIGDWLDSGTVENIDGTIRLEAAPGKLFGFSNSAKSEQNWNLGSGPGRVYHVPIKLGDWMPQFSKLIARRVKPEANLPDSFFGIVLTGRERAALRRIDKMAGDSFCLRPVAERFGTPTVVSESSLNLMDIVCGAQIPVSC